MGSDIDQRCRMCAEIVTDQAGLLSILDTSQQELMEWVNEYLDFRIDDGPTKICIPCKERIQNCINFKTKCEITNKEFGCILAKIPPSFVKPSAVRTNSSQICEPSSSQICEPNSPQQFEQRSSSTFLDKWLQTQRAVTTKLKFTENKSKKPTESKNDKNLLSKYNIRNSYVKLQYLSLNKIRKYTKNKKTGSKNESGYLSSQSNTTDVEKCSKNKDIDDDNSNCSETSTVLAPVFNVDCSEDSRTEEEPSGANIEEASTGQRGENWTRSEPLCDLLTSAKRQASARTGSRKPRKKLCELRAMRQKSDDPDSKLFGCKYCNAAFLSKSGRFKHNAKYHPRSKPTYECVVCNKKFPFIFKLKDHLRKCHPEYRPFTCHICDDKFQEKYKLLKHIQYKHVHTTPYSSDNCKTSFKSKTSLKCHILKNPGEHNYQCDICKETYKIKEQLRVHICRHLGIFSFHCNLCDKSFVSKTELSSHRRKHEKRFKCLQCSKRFNCATYLKSHMKTVHSCVALFKCTKCPSTFTLQGNMKQHLRRMHRNNRDFKCDTCSKLFKTKGELESHLVVHKTARPFKCDKCSLTFKTKNRQRTHKLRVHVRGDFRPHICPQCNKGFKYIGNLTEHIQGVHGSEHKFPCTKCDKKFKLKGALKIHLIFHENEKNYTCEYCSKTFCHSSNFKRHVKTVHHKILTYQCYQCKKKFGSKGQLKSHMFSHSEARDSKCDLCSRMFKNDKEVGRHKARMHNDLRPFTCHTCNKTFKSKAELRGHVQYHSNVRLFKCKTCRKRFFSNSNLREHVLGMHKHVRLYKCKQCTNVAFRLYSELRNHMEENHYEAVL